jgi:hypothetical protein
MARDLSVPDLSLTAGVVAITSMRIVCATKWGADRRHVTAAMKLEVFARYGLTGNTDKACVPDRHGRRCEIDHLISRELGGADAIKNLWPQPYGLRPWSAVMKDRVENRLHKEVCARNISLADAQRDIVRDWRVVYRRYFGE